MLGLCMIVKDEEKVSAEKKKQSDYADWEIRNAQALKKSLSEAQQYDLKRAEIQRDIQKGIITETEGNKALAGWKQIIFGKDESHNTLLQQARNFYLSQVGAVENLTKAQIALNQVRQGDDFKKLTAAQQKEIVNLYEMASANEKLKKAEVDRKAQMEYIARLTGQADKMGSDYYNGLKIIDKAYEDGNITLERRIQLMNDLYKVSSSYRAYQSIESTVTKNISDVETQRASIQAQYGMDFKTETEKARISALTAFAIRNVVLKHSKKKLQMPMLLLRKTKLMLLLNSMMQNIKKLLNFTKKKIKERKT